MNEFDLNIKAHISKFLEYIIKFLLLNMIFCFSCLLEKCLNDSCSLKSLNSTEMWEKYKQVLYKWERPIFNVYTGSHTMSNIEQVYTLVDY